MLFQQESDFCQRYSPETGADENRGGRWPTYSGRDMGTQLLQVRAETAVSRVREKLASMRAELDESREDVSRLTGEVRFRRSQQRRVREVAVGSLRRRLAYRFHPDRGGDTELMSRLNLLLDVVESLQTGMAMTVLD